jgi:hypothetical protein
VDSEIIFGASNFSYRDAIIHRIDLNFPVLKSTIPTAYAAFFFISCRNSFLGGPLSREGTKRRVETDKTSYSNKSACSWSTLPFWYYLFKN